MLYYGSSAECVGLIIITPLRGYNYSLLHIFNEITFFDKNDPIWIKEQ